MRATLSPEIPRAAGLAHLHAQVAGPQPFQEVVPGEDLDRRRGDTRLALQTHDHGSLHTAFIGQNAQAAQVTAVHPRAALHFEGHVHFAPGRAYPGTLSEGYRWWWAYIPHFVHTPFYCYAYAFGELLVLALYDLYRREGAAFVPRYVQLLEAGGSAPPEVLLARVGVDVTDPGFWRTGLAPFAALVEEPERLADAQVGAAGSPGQHTDG